MKVIYQYLLRHRNNGQQYHQMDRQLINNCNNMSNNSTNTINTINTINTNDSNSNTNSNTNNNNNSCVGSRHIISNDSIIINKELGVGEFGVVQQGLHLLYNYNIFQYIYV